MKFVISLPLVVPNEIKKNHLSYCWYFGILKIQYWCKWTCGCLLKYTLTVIKKLLQFKKNVTSLNLKNHTNFPLHPNKDMLTCRSHWETRDIPEKVLGELLCFQDPQWSQAYPEVSHPETWRWHHATVYAGLQS